MNDVSVYNVMGTQTRLALLRKAFPLMIITEKYAPNDWEVEVYFDDEDRFSEFCEEHGIAACFR